MKKISNLTFVGYILGIAFALFSGVRYFLLYPDMDKAIVYVVIGIMACAIAFLYNKYTSLSYSVNAIEDYITDKSFGEREETEKNNTEEVKNGDME